MKKLYTLIVLTAQFLTAAEANLALAAQSTPTVNPIDQRLTAFVASYVSNLPKIAKEKEKKMKKEQIIISNVVDFIRAFCPSDVASDSTGLGALQMKLAHFVDTQKPIVLFFKGFPFKAMYSGKCLSDNADFADYLACLTLNHMVQEIKKVYTPGCVLKIFSDGLPYELAWDPDDSVIQQYQEQIKDMMGAAAGHFPPPSYLSGVGPAAVEYFTLLEPTCYLKGTAPANTAALRQEIAQMQCAKPAVDLELRQWVRKEFRGWQGYASCTHSQRLLDHELHILDSDADDLCAHYQLKQSQFSQFLTRSCLDPSWIQLTVHNYKNLRKVPIVLIPGIKKVPWNATILLMEDGTITIAQGKKNENEHTFRGLALKYK